mmetsp:Transcript_8578/g.13228  ORF Transcript_8578/g.13228 Transcript_8578/m.13228 type:complete len:746 (+) Transcript_8578:157-2394(+)|eukprot:CAMPEP_0178910252 /NCGR_PEP_ID=MMETSP0786-20121207/8993_1 /TAXON_ID=186022 /ORGANISM="Thalassionema frauenfeldii, Strain CCMP 1798" /LENGTH=745 /DNA_ID=CAMNT_0020582481 /DNA_START=147 /DNA_END=2384 /DNA_ORIENTATION=+
MAPMARTNRNSSLNALDDLNLDDMFEGGEDGLFDDLQMDIGELGDITNNDSAPSSLAVPPVPKGLDDMQFDLLGDIGVDDGATSPVQEQDNLKKPKRKTKRKKKGITHFDDDDDADEEPLKKKRRANNKKTKGTTKKSKDQEPNQSKSKNKSSVLERGTSGTVPLAGQFGGRKRGNQPMTKPSNKNKSKLVPGVIPSMANSAPYLKTGKANESIPQTTNKRSRSTAEIPKPLETLFCGLHPSNSLFYPFVPLPPESSMKKCNKHYPNIDKMHAALAPTTPGPDIEDSLMKLLMLHDTMPTKEKKQLMSASVMTSRMNFTSLDRQQLSLDLKSIATLVKRQHDFLAQSLGNMERWCKKNFSGDDYRTVYGGEKPKPLIAQLTSPIVRVKIRCSGFKEPKIPLIAHVPLPGAAVKAPATTSSAMTKKKRPEPKSVIVEKAPIKDEVPLKYIDLPPKSRRKRIVDIMTKHAQVLEGKQVEREESRRKSMEKNSQMQQKVVDDDDLVQLNTTALWKWIGKTGRLADVSKDDVRDLLALEPEPSEDYTSFEESRRQNKPKRHLADSFSNRLQALLIDVNSDDDGNFNGNDNETDDEDEPIFNSTWESTNGASSDVTLLDISALTIEERAFIHLRSSGLIDASFPLHAIVSEEDDEDEEDESSFSESYEFEDLIRRMKADLVDIDSLNNSRMKFVKNSANAHVVISQYRKQEEETNSQLIAKCNNLMKKQKETKRSARQKVQKKDEDWVPW